MRATKLKYCAGECASENNPESKQIKKSTAPKRHRRIKAVSVFTAVTLAMAILVIPTTTLAPDVDAFEDSKAASLSVGDLSEFAAIISDNCFIAPTEPVTQAPTTAAKATEKPTKAEETTKEEETTEAGQSSQTSKSESSQTETSKTETSEVNETEYEHEQQSSQNSSQSSAGVSSSGSYLVNISNPDSSYSPSPVSLSAYDRAKLERLVMGEAGSMGYTGCALVAQSIRDAMNRSNTSSIDRIISEYKYYAPTNKEPNSTVKSAVSFIFDQNGSAVQHRVLCFYTGTSGWHETQNYITSVGNVRFFDLWY